jgi:cytochrome c-type biogenesis protein CcmH
MALFLVLASLLVGAAVAVATASLWRDSRRLALALAVAMPLAAIGLYRLHGAPAALDPRNTAPQAAEEPASLEQAIAALEQRVAAGPAKTEDLALLGRTYMALERYAEAPAVFARAVAQAPGDADLAVDYAESLLRTAPDHRFPPLAVAQVEAALELQPQHQRALFFLGLYHLQEDRPGDAAATWERLLPTLDAEAAAALRPRVDEARLAARLPPLPPVAPTADTPGLDVTVELAPALAEKAPGGGVLFVFARAPGGGGPPLAARRVEVAQWPVRVRLTDADSPMPAAKLSSVPTADLVARLSLGGRADPASGDLESAPQAVATDGKAPVVLVLDHVRP